MSPKRRTSHAEEAIRCLQRALDNVRQLRRDNVRLRQENQELREESVELRTRIVWYESQEQQERAS